MYNTNGAITGVSLDGTKRTTPLKQIQNYMLAKLNANNNHQVAKGGAGSNGPAIWGNGYGFAAGNSSATGAANL